MDTESEETDVKTPFPEDSRAVPFLRMPTEDWEFNVFLINLAEEITEEELEKMKYLCMGDCGIGEGTLSRAQTPLEFFTLLRHRGHLSRINLLQLQAMIWHVRNKRLHEIAVAFAQRIGETLYFYPTRNVPEDLQSNLQIPSEFFFNFRHRAVLSWNGLRQLQSIVWHLGSRLLGYMADTALQSTEEISYFEPAHRYKHVQFHVHGNLETCKRRDLEQIRAVLSRLLVVPEKHVIIQGLAPSSSLSLTFMIPEACIDIVMHLAKEGHISLIDLGITSIIIDDTTIQLPGTQIKYTKESWQQYGGLPAHHSKTNPTEPKHEDQLFWDRIIYRDQLFVPRDFI